MLVSEDPSFQPVTRLQTSLALAAALALSAIVDALPSPAPLAPLENATTLIQVPVVLRPEDRVRVDRVGNSNDRTFRSGEVFAAVFTGTAGADQPTVEITSTRVDAESGAFGLARLYTFEITAKLRMGRQEHVLTASGTERHPGSRNPETHAQLACERATVDLAKQIQTLLARRNRPNATPPGEFRSPRHGAYPSG